jgi:hypothetical protein
VAGPGKSNRKCRGEWKKKTDGRSPTTASTFVLTPLSDSVIRAAKSNFLSVEGHGRGAAAGVTSPCASMIWAPKAISDQSSLRHLEIGTAGVAVNRKKGRGIDEFAGRAIFNPNAVRVDYGETGAFPDNEWVGLASCASC